MTLPRDPNTKAGQSDLDRGNASATTAARQRRERTSDDDASDGAHAQEDQDQNLDQNLDQDADEDLSDDDASASSSVAREASRAAFLEDLPDVPELRPLIAAFVAGNYARLRELSAALAQSSNDAAVLAAARELVARTSPDPLAKKLLWLSMAFFLALVSWVYLHHAH